MLRISSQRLRPQIVEQDARRGIARLKGFIRGQHQIFTLRTVPLSRPKQCLGRMLLSTPGPQLLVSPKVITVPIINRVPEGGSAR